MNRFVLSLLLALLALGAVWGQGDDLIGVWEMEVGDEDGDLELYVYEFREDGILIQNEYYEDDLECVYVFPYEVDGNVVTVGEGLNWEYDAETGEFELYEDFAAETEEIVFEYDVTDGELTLSLSEDGLLAEILDLAYNGIELDLEEDLGLGISDPDQVDELDLSSEEIDSLLEDVFLFGLIEELEFALDVSLEDFEVDEDADIDDVVVALIDVAILAMLEDLLDIEIDEDVELGLAEAADAEDVIANLAEVLELDVDELDIAEEDIEEFDSALEGLELALEALDEALETIGELTFESSDLSTLLPSETFALPNGMSAVEAMSWGQVKEDLSRR